MVQRYDIKNKTRLVQISGEDPVPFLPDPDLADVFLIINKQHLYALFLSDFNI